MLKEEPMIISASALPKIVDSDNEKFVPALSGCFYGGCYIVAGVKA